MISYTGSIQELFSSSKGTLLRIPGIGSKTIEGILSKSSFEETEKIIQTCEASNINIVHFLDRDYPKQLRDVFDAPTLLFIKGDLKTLKQRSVAVVGTRKATSYGKEVTRNIVSELSQLDTAIVSGLAYGIDIEAHRTALDHNLINHSVLASGLNVVYPKSHWPTAQKISETGCLISENPPDTKPDARLFPARNRIIAALADVTIVVEAAEKGGALITANIAYSYDKPVFAVPGNLTNNVSTGCNNLIKQQKALIYTGVNDLLYHLNWDGNINQPVCPDHETLNLTKEEKAILIAMQQDPTGMSVDEISCKSLVPLTQLASLLLALEFSGLIRSLPGKKYQTNRPVPA